MNPFKKAFRWLYPLMDPYNDPRYKAPAVDVKIDVHWYNDLDHDVVEPVLDVPRADVRAAVFKMLGAETIEPGDYIKFKWSRHRKGK